MLMQCGLWTCLAVVIPLQDSGVEAISDSTGSTSGNAPTSRGLPGFLSATEPLSDSVKMQRKAAWMLLESVGDVLDRTAKDPEFDPEPAMATLSHAMESQILQNGPALGLPNYASHSRGDGSIPNSTPADESAGLKPPASSGLVSSSFAQEQEGEDALLGNCMNKKLCFTCNGGAFNTGFFITFRQWNEKQDKDEDNSDDDDRDTGSWTGKHSSCDIDQIWKLQKEAQAGRAPDSGVFASRHACRLRIQRHDARNTLNMVRQDRLGDIVDAMNLQSDMQVPECEEACKVSHSDNHRYAFKLMNDPMIKKGYSMSIQQCQKQLPEWSGANGNPRLLVFSLALSVLLSS